MDASIRLQQPFRAWINFTNDELVLVHSDEAGYSAAQKLWKSIARDRSVNIYVIKLSICDRWATYEAHRSNAKISVSFDFWHPVFCSLTCFPPKHDEKGLTALSSRLLN